MKTHPSVRQIPNLLTLSRIGLSISFPWIAARWRLPVVAGALLSEYLDGALARRFHCETELGRVLDPVADKLFFAFVAGTFVVEQRMSWFELLGLGVRDFAVTAAILYWGICGRLDRVTGLRPLAMGKVTTVLQYAAFLWILIESPPRSAWSTALVALAFSTGVAAIVQYAVQLRQVDCRS